MRFGRGCSHQEVDVVNGCCVASAQPGKSVNSVGYGVSPDPSLAFPVRAQSFALHLHQPKWTMPERIDAARELRL